MFVFKWFFIINIYVYYKLIFVYVESVMVCVFLDSNVFFCCCVEYFIVDDILFSEVVLFIK